MGEKHQVQQTLWDTELQPTEPGENTPEAQDMVSRMSKVAETQSGLSSEAESEAAKFGDDVKFLADFTNGVRKFEPWINKSEEKAKSMKGLLDDSKAAANKMTLHDDADRQYEAFNKRWEAVNKTADEWIAKMNELCTMWEKQEETAAKVTAAIAAPQGAGAEMKLEDLEAHLNALKQMFIDKQKMMEGIESPSA